MSVFACSKSPIRFVFSSCKLGKSTAEVCPTILEAEGLDVKSTNPMRENPRIHPATFQWSNEKPGPLGWLGYIGDYVTAQLYRDYFINHDIRIPSLTNQVATFFFKRIFLFQVEVAIFSRVNEVNL